MLYGRLTYKELQRLVEEALRKNQGDLVELERDLAEQLADSMGALVALIDAEAEAQKHNRSHVQSDLLEE